MAQRGLGLTSRRFRTRFKVIGRALAESRREPQAVTFTLEEARGERRLKPWKRALVKNVGRTRNALLGSGRTARDVWHAYLLASNPQFNPALIEQIPREKRTRLWGSKTHERLQRFLRENSDMDPRDYFLHSAPLADEAFHYLVLEEGLHPAEAARHAFVLGSKSVYFRGDENLRKVNEFALRTWAEHRANELYSVLKEERLNRDNTFGERRQAFVQDIAAALADSVRHGEQEGMISLRVLWGGHKEDPREGYEREEQALEHLAELRRKLRKLGVWVHVELLFCDWHSQKINNVPAARIQAYKERVEQLAGRKGFDIRDMSSLWRRHFQLSVDDVARAAGTIKSLGDLRSLVERAGRHAVEGAPESAAERYVTVRALERRMLDEKREPGTIYVAYADPSDAAAREVSPSMSLFLWPQRRNEGTPPWMRKKGGARES
jgi:hypothetical protein